MALNNLKKFGNILGASIAFTLSGTTAFVTYSIYSGNEKFYSNYAMPLIHKVTDGEDAHNLAVKMAKYGLVHKSKEIKNAEILVILQFCFTFKFMKAFYIVNHKRGLQFLKKSLKIL